MPEDISTNKELTSEAIPIKDIAELKELSDSLSDRAKEDIKLTPMEIKSVKKALTTQIYLGDHASLPMICCGPRCPVALTCPLQQIEKAPIAQRCHPPGELILTTKHGYIPIEKLDPAIHRLVGYEKKHNAIRREKNQIGSTFKLSVREYDGNLVHIKTIGNKEYRATPDHVCIAKFNEKALNKFCVYIMKKGNYWRIGKTYFIKQANINTRDQKSSAGFRNRLNMEMGDSLWILGVYNTNTDALLAEEYYSVKYGISKTCFIDSLDKIKSKYDGLYRWVTKEQLIQHHNSLMKDETYYKEILEKHGLLINYPFYTRLCVSYDNPETGPRPVRPMFIRACNLIPDIMDVPVIPDNDITLKLGSKNYKVADWEAFKISRESYIGNVYSLDASRYHTYFVNKIATHNCPIEMTLMGTWKGQYEMSLVADWNDKVERQAVMDLVEADILSARANGIIAAEGFIMENVVGISESTGEPIYRKEKHVALEVKDMIHRRKERLLKSLVLTREMKKKLGMGGGDPAKKESELLERAKKSKERELADAKAHKK